MDDITDFLYLIGSVFAPMIAIQIADFFILKRDRADKAVDICNIIVWLAGFAAYRFLMNVDIIVGNTLPDMVFTNNHPLRHSYQNRRQNHLKIQESVNAYNKVKSPSDFSDGDFYI